MSESTDYERAIFASLVRQAGATAVKDWDWEELVARASAHGVLPAIAFGAEISVPEEVRELLEVVRTANAERNRAVLRDLRENACALNEIGIEPVALKGLAGLLIGLYDDISRRHLADMDLLVPADRMQDAAGVLKGLGYSFPDLHPMRAAAS